MKGGGPGGGAASEGGDQHGKSGKATVYDQQGEEKIGRERPRRVLQRMDENAGRKNSGGRVTGGEGRQEKKKKKNAG